MAASWEKRNLGRRLQPESLDQNQAVVIAELADWNPATTPAVTHPVNQNNSHRWAGKRHSWITVSTPHWNNTALSYTHKPTQIETLCADLPPNKNNRGLLLLLSSFLTILTRTTGLHSNERPQHTEETAGLESSCEENICDHRWLLCAQTPPSYKAEGYRSTDFHERNVATRWGPAGESTLWKIWFYNFGLNTSDGAENGTKGRAVSNLSKALICKEQATMLDLNNFITGLDEQIPALPTVIFGTEGQHSLD